MTDTSKDPLAVPKGGAGDVAHAGLRAGLTTLPFVGGPAAELLDTIMAPPIERRRDRWMHAVADALNELQMRVTDLEVEKLGDNEVFVTTVLHATQAASRTHQDEKIEALRSAVMNAALPNPPDEDQQQMFVTFVDDLTAWHLRILKFFDEPKIWFSSHGVQPETLMMGAPVRAMERAFPELRGKREFYDQLFRDLDTRGLLHGNSMHTTMTGNGVYESRTTQFGKQFLSFITPPF